MAFDTAIYTDVSAEESVDGTSGFGFLTVSDGIDEGHKAKIVQRMLHANSPRWPLEADPEQHPQTLAYLADEGRYFFSRGKSTGATISGRRGNQLTQIAVTDREEDIAPLVPAQLFASSEWTMQRTSEQPLDRWVAPLEIDSQFDTAELIEWVKESEGRISHLEAIIAALEEREEKKTVLIAEDIDTVIRWFSLGTMMLGAEQAIGVDLRAFVDDLYNNSATFIAVHPSLQPDRLDGANVIDVTADATAAPASSPVAQILSGWVRERESFEAIEAVELFRRWEPALATDLAASAVNLVLDLDSPMDGKSKWTTGISLIEGLVAADRAADVETYLDEVAEALATYTPTSEGEIVAAASAAAKARSANVNGLTEALVGATLSGLEQDPRYTGAWARALLGEDDWDWGDIDNRYATVNRLVRLTDSRGINDADLDPILRLIQPLHNDIDDPELELKLADISGRAVDYEIVNPGHSGKGIYEWPTGQEEADAVRVAVVRDVAQQWENFRAGKWDYLASHGHSRNNADATFNNWVAAGEAARTPKQDLPAWLKDNGREVDPTSSRYVLADATMPEDSDVFIAWAQSVGVDDWLVDKVLDYSNTLVDIRPERGRKKDIHTALDVLESFEDDNLSPRQVDLVQEIEQKLWKQEENIPSMMDEMNAAVNNAADNIKNMFKRGKRRRDKRA